MKAKAIVIVSVAMTTISTFGQVPKPFFGDKGCPAKSSFANDVKISGDDFIEVHHLQSYAIAPVYTVRIYGDGRLMWHGEAKVQSIGEASGSIGAPQAKALIEHARQLGFGDLCDEYVMRAFDGSISVTTLSIGGQMKVVTSTGPSDAPLWLHKLGDEVAALEPVQKLIGKK